MTFAEPATATWDVRGLLNSVKATTTVISSLKTAAAVKNWLLKDRRDPLRRALDGTIAKYEGTFPNIGPQLASLLSNPQFEAELQRLTEVGASNFSEIAASLAKAADFYDPDGGGFGEVLQTLIEAFDEELLLGSEGPVHHDRKQTALVQHVSAQVAGVSEHMAVMQALLGSERLRQVVARTKRRAEGRSYSEARAMWVLAEEEVAASGDTESAFQVHSEIGTLECGITHCSCLPARIICSRAARRGRVGKSRIVPSADLASAGIDGGANASWVVKNITVTNRAGLRAGIGESTSGGWAAGKRFAGTSHAPAHQTRSNLKEN